MFCACWKGGTRCLLGSGSGSGGELGNGDVRTGHASRMGPGVLWSATKAPSRAVIVIKVLLQTSAATAHAAARLSASPVMEVVEAPPTAAPVGPTQMALPLEAVAVKAVMVSGEVAPLLQVMLFVAMVDRVMMAMWPAEAPMVELVVPPTIVAAVAALAAASAPPTVSPVVPMNIAQRVFVLTPAALAALFRVVRIVVSFIELVTMPLENNFCAGGGSCDDANGGGC